MRITTKLNNIMGLLLKLNMLCSNNYNQLLLKTNIAMSIMTRRFHWAYQRLPSWMSSDSWGSSGLKEHRQSQILALCFPLSHHLSLPAPHYHSCGQQPVSVGRKMTYQRELSAHRTWNNWSMEDTTLSCKINVWSLQVCLQFEYNLRGRPLWLVFSPSLPFSLGKYIGKTVISWSDIISYYYEWPLQ